MRSANPLFRSVSILAMLACLTCCLPTFPTTVLAGTKSSIEIHILAPQLVAHDADIRLTATRRLGHYGQAALQPLQALAEHGTMRERRGAMMGLTLLPYPALAMKTFVNGLHSEDVTIRSLAAHGLALSGPASHRPLAQLLTDEDTHVRNGAAYALTLMKKNALPVLISLLDTQDSYTRAKAAWILGRMGSEARGAVPALIRALPCEDPRAMHVVAEAIDLIQPDPATMLHHLLLLNSKNGNPVRRIGQAAASILTELLTRPGTPLGQAAFRALASIGPDAEPPLRKVLASGTPSQQIGAALLLAAIDPDIVRTLPESIRTSLAGVKPQP